MERAEKDKGGKWDSCNRIAIQKMIYKKNFGLESKEMNSRIRIIQDSLGIVRNQELQVS